MRATQKFAENEAFQETNQNKNANKLKNERNGRLRPAQTVKSYKPPATGFERDIISPREL